MIAAVLQIAPGLLWFLLACWMVFQLAAGVATAPLGLIKRSESPRTYWFLVAAEIVGLLISAVGYFGA